jgi:hypothetical protein
MELRIQRRNTAFMFVILIFIRLTTPVTDCQRKAIFFPKIYKTRWRLPQEKERSVSTGSLMTSPFEEFMRQNTLGRQVLGPPCKIHTWHKAFEGAYFSFYFYLHRE